MDYRGKFQSNTATEEPKTPIGGQHRLLLWILGAAVALGLLAAAAIALIPLLSRPQAPADTPGPTEPSQPVMEEPLIPPSLYGEGDFALDERGFLSCLAGPYRVGLDVSEFQEDIDWAQVKEAGIDFVFIRIGGRGYGKAGNMYADSRAQEYYRGAKEAGLKVGAYFFSQATSGMEAVEEALFALELTRDWELDLPMVYDWEFVNSEARTAGMKGSTLMVCTRIFCRIVERAGHTAMVYFNQFQAENLLRLEDLRQYPWWLAMYTDQYTYPHQVQYWQYTYEGTVPGIGVPVDINLFFPEA